MKNLTVAKLIELLKNTSNQNAKVILEGCDCAANCIGISKGEDAYKGEIILRVDHGVFDLGDDLKIDDGETE